MNRFHRSFELQLVSLCMIALITIITIVHVTVYIAAKNIIEDEIISSAKGLANTIALYIERDLDEYKAFVAFVSSFEVEDQTKGIDVAHYKDSDYYQRMQSFFRSIKAYSNIHYIYTERKINDTMVEYILDAEPINSPNHSPPRSADETNQGRESVYFTGQPTGYRLAYYSGWGSLLGGYAPIFDEDKETLLGIVGVDIDGSHLYHHLHTLQIMLFVVYVLIISMALLLLINFSNAILEPLLRDKLTGAYNKRYSDKLLRGEIAIALKERRDLALLMIDLDHFKQINDTYGHNFGDKVLSAVSTTIRNSLRQKDHFIRYGGEEFLAVIPTANEQRAVEVAERVRQAVEKNEIYHAEKDISIKMTISIGIANLNGAGLGVPEFVENADKALYAAKKARNCVAVFGRDTDNEPTG